MPSNSRWLHRPLALLVSTVLVSCADTTRHSWDYKALSTEQTPKQWRADSAWTFVTTLPTGKTERVTFRITDEKAKTCVSGVWRKLVLLEGKLGSFEGIPSQAAYHVEGRFLWVSLNSNWCDDNDDIRGELASDAFNGERTAGGIFGSTPIGTVRGWRVPQRARN